MKPQYEYNKEWRKNHPEARAAAAKRNYDKSRDGAFNAGQPWTQHEDELVLTSSLTDRELAAKIGRSAHSIQIRRVRLNKKEK